jgi:hypothetical protein
VNPTYSPYIEDASFLRLQNVTLGYDVPTRLVPGEFVGAARLTLTGQNLWITTRYSGAPAGRIPGATRRRVPGTRGCTSPSDGDGGPATPPPGPD